MIDRERLGTMLANARIKTNLSQEHMAMELGVSRNTIINWEKGLSQPNVDQCFKWFNILGINPMKPFLEYLYPQTFKNVTPKSEDEDIKSCVLQYINSMPPKSVRQLAYLFFGEHGSSPISLLELFTAYLHLNMRSKVAIASSVATAYDMSVRCNDTICNDNVSPDFELVNKSIEKAKDAVVNNQLGYCSNESQIP